MNKHGLQWVEDSRPCSFRRMDWESLSKETKFQPRSVSAEMWWKTWGESVLQAKVAHVQRGWGQKLLTVFGKP